MSKITEQKVVTLDEEGYHDDINSDEDTWIQTGWHVRTYYGDVLYRHNEKQPVE